MLDCRIMGMKSMKKEEQKKVSCGICGKMKLQSETLPGELVRPSVVEAIRKSFPDWAPAGYVCRDDLNRFRTQYIQDVIEADKGELSTLEEQVVKSLKEYELLSSNVNLEFERRLTLGERLADRVASFGGSWRFILIFSFVLASWIAINSAVLIWRPFDPYPFILLNLVLSCLASIQAPIIMMSQNRHEGRNRSRAEYDYRVNL